MLTATYPAMFYYDDTDSAKIPYFILFPDFQFGATQGTSIDDGMKMAADWLGITIADMLEDAKTLPTPTPIDSLSIIDDFPFKDEDGISYDAKKSFITSITVELDDYVTK